MTTRSPIADTPELARRRETRRLLDVETRQARRRHDRPVRRIAAYLRRPALAR